MVKQFADLMTPKDTHPLAEVPKGRREDLPRMRNIYQFDDIFNDQQEDVYDSFTRVMPNERRLSAFENERSIYHDNAYDKQVMRPRRPLVKGEYQKRWDGLDHAPFSYATNGLLNEGNHFNSRQIELYPNMYQFPKPTTLNATIYKASKRRSYA
jgi:hypothetical protein